MLLVSVEGERWTVKVVGRSGGRPDPATPLLLLGFWKAGEDGGRRRREALVVGRALADLSPAALRNAVLESTPPPEPERAGKGREGPDRRGRGRRRGRRR